MLRLDDLEVYLKIVLEEYRRTRTINRLVTSISWMPISKGREIWQESRYTMIHIANSLEYNYKYYIYLY